MKFVFDFFFNFLYFRLAASHSQKGGSLKDKRKMIVYEDNLFADKKE